MKLLQKIAEIIRSNKRFGSMGYKSCFIQFVGNLELETKGDEEEDEKEELNFENFCFSKVEPDEIVFCAGGDWQNPLKVTLRLNENGDIFIAHVEEGYDDDYTIKFDQIMEKV